MLGVLGVDKLFDYMEIFPSQKYAHFKKYKKHLLSHLCFIPAIRLYSSIKKSSGIDYSDMLFFDDEYRNIRDISKLGKNMGGYQTVDCYTME